MAQLSREKIASSDGQSILDEIIQWQESLDHSMIDSMINEVLETVIDIIYDNSECEAIYENT